MPDDFINFLTASPSSYHAAHTGAHLLNQAGFTHHTETDPWDAQPGGHYLIRGGALIAWHIPTQLPTQPAFRIIGAHTDSPGFKLKHTPDHTTYGFNQAAVEIYGGPIISSWFDRDLKLAGIITPVKTQQNRIKTALCPTKLGLTTALVRCCYGDGTCTLAVVRLWEAQGIKFGYIWARHH